jgi:hypothetical protein
MEEMEIMQNGEDPNSYRCAMFLLTINVLEIGTEDI